EQLPAAFIDCKQRLEAIYPALEALTQTIALEERQSNYRFPNGKVPDDLLLHCVELQRSFSRLSELLGKMVSEIEEAMEDPHCPVPKIDLENHFPVIGTWQARAEATTQLWASYAIPDTEASVPRARWLTPVDSSGSMDIEVCSSPILAARTLE